MAKSDLQALAGSFGIDTEGLTVEQLQNALDANTGYQKFLAADNAAKELSDSLEEEKQKTANLTAELTTANADLSAKQGELDAAVEKNEAQEKELEVLRNAAASGVEVKEEAVSGEKSPVVFKAADGKKYEITQSEFRFRGKVYKSDVAVKENKDVLEILVAAKSFILKKA